MVFSRVSLPRENRAVILNRFVAAGVRRNFKGAATAARRRARRIASRHVASRRVQGPPLRKRKNAIRLCYAPDAQ